MKNTAAETQSHRADSLKILKKESSLGLRASAAGFTLIEVLVALVVTVAALGIIAQGLTTGARASTLAQKATRAAMLAQQVMTGLETGEIALNSNASQSFDDEPDFSFETVSTDDPDNAGLTYLEVTVKWKDRDQNEDRTYRLTRLMRDKTSTAAATTPSNP